jgi:hypothetical protein
MYDAVPAAAMKEIKVLAATSELPYFTPEKEKKKGIIERLNDIKGNGGDGDNPAGVPARPRKPKGQER